MRTSVVFSDTSAPDDTVYWMEAEEIAVIFGIEPKDWHVVVFDVAGIESAAGALTDANVICDPGQRIDPVKMAADGFSIGHTLNTGGNTGSLNDGVFRLRSDTSLAPYPALASSRFGVDVFESMLFTKVSAAIWTIDIEWGLGEGGMRRYEDQKNQDEILRPELTIAPGGQFFRPNIYGQPGLQLGTDGD